MNKSELEKMKIEYADARFKNNEEVQNYFNQKRLNCLICGKTYKSLGSHLCRTHDITVDEYKEIFNIPWGESLACQSTRQKQAENLSRRVESGSMPRVDPKVLVELHRNKPKRKIRDYHIDRLKDIQDLAAAAHHNASKEKVLKLFDVMEENNCTEWAAMQILGMTTYNLVKVTLEYFPELKERYDQVCAKIRRGVARKTKMSHDEIREQIFQLRLTGITNEEIAQRLNIGKTTVKRAITKQGAFAKCKDTSVEHIPIPMTAANCRKVAHKNPGVRKVHQFDLPYEERVAKFKQEFQSKRMKSRKEAYDYVANDTIICLICGAELQSMSAHLKNIHGISTEDYKDIFNIPWKLGLIGARARKVQGDKARQRMLDDPDRIRKALACKDAPSRKKRTKNYSKYKPSGVHEAMKARTKELAIKILDAMEEYMRPALTVCRLPDMPKIQSLNSAMKYFPEIRERYDQLRLAVKEYRMNETRENRKIKRRKGRYV